MQTTVRLGAALAAVVAFALPSAADAQTELPPREFGIDAGVSFGIGDQNTTSIGIPARSLRIGFFNSPTLSFEPYGGLTYEDADGGNQLNLLVGAGVLWHLAPPRTGTALYVRPFADLAYLAVDNEGDGDGADNDDTRFGLGVGLGIKRPWRDRFATRLEGNIGYRTDPGSTELGILLGLSFYTN